MRLSTRALRLRAGKRAYYSGIISVSLRSLLFSKLFRAQAGLAPGHVHGSDNPFLFNCNDNACNAWKCNY